MALLIPDTADHQRRLINGILAWHRTHGHWSIYTRGFLPIMDYRELPAWRGDGVIAMVDDARQYAALLRKGLPAVNCSARLPTPRLATVLSDNEAIGRLAAQHLYENGFRRFAYVGETSFMHDLLRLQGFREAAREHGCECEKIVPRFRTRTRYLYAEAKVDVAKLAAALRRLPRPVGVLAAHDDIGCWVLEACLHAGLRVPDDVSVVGVNNHQWLCELAHPHLSSIEQDAETIGQEAAALLDRLLGGERPGAAPLLVPPTRLVQRASSDALAGEDAFVARALRFIRNHACEGIRVPDVARQAGLSRRALEMRFRAHLERTIGEEIERVRMDQARRLLADGRDPVYEVAARSGYPNYHTFCLAFRRRHRVSPLEYRTRHRRPA